MRAPARAVAAWIAAAVLAAGCTGAVGVPGTTPSAGPGVGGLDGGTLSGPGGSGLDGGAAGPDAGSTARACAPAAPLFSDPSGGAVVHVAPGGNDTTGDGSVDRPLATLVAAAAKVRPGDVIELAAGTYTPRTGQSLSGLAGTATAPIWIRSAAGDRATLDTSGASDAAYGALSLVNSRYVIVDGLEIVNGAGIGLNLYESDHVIARNLRIHDVRSGAVYIRGADISLESSTIYNCVMRNQGRGYDWDSCVQTAQRDDKSLSARVTFRGLDIHDAYGECLNHWYVDGALTVDNVIHDCWSAGIYADHARNVVISRNRVYWTSDAWNNPLFGTVNGVASRASGIEVSTEPPFTAGATTGRPENIVVTNNVVSGAGVGIWYWHSTNDTTDNTWKDLVVAYNVVVAPRNVPFLADATGSSPAPSGGVLANNVFFPGGNGMPASLGNPDAWRVSGNDWVGAVPAFAAGNGNRADDPRLVGPLDGGVTLEQARLASGSPLRSVGSPVTQETHDAFCRTRSGSAPSVGLDEAP